MVGDLLSCMMPQGVRQSVTTVNSLLHAYAQCGEADKAEALYARLPELNHTVTLTAANCVITAHCNAKQTAKAVDWLLSLPSR